MYNNVLIRYTIFGVWMLSLMVIFNGGATAQDTNDSLLQGSSSSALAYFTPADEGTQSGTVIGEVIDPVTGETLPGATVAVQGTHIGVSTDVDGRYTLRRVPAGSQTLEIRYMGYEIQEITVTVISGERIVQNIELQPDLIEGDEVIVQARQRGQSRALTRQRESVNIRSVVSSEQIDRFGDETVTGALQRVAGMGHGGANIRGVGAGASNVTMDGQRMGSTDRTDRGVDLSTISADMVQDLEVIKVITPNMDADALSGVINVNTRRPIGGERDFNARLGGGATSRFAGLTGPAYRASFSYGDSPSDNFSFGINLSYLRSISASESFSMGWGTRTFEHIDGPVDLLTGLSTNLSMGPRDRYATGFQFTFQPTDRSTFHVQAMLNRQNREQMSYGKRFPISLQHYTRSPYHTGPRHDSGGHQMWYDTSLNAYKTDQYTFRLGARHLFDGFDMEYALGWGHGRHNHDRYIFNFGASGGSYEWDIDISDRWRPLVDVNEYGNRTAWPTQQELELYDGRQSYRWDGSVNNEFRGSIDFDVPYSSAVNIKFGASGLMTFKAGDRENFSGSMGSRFSVDQFDHLLNADWHIMGRNEHRAYHIPYLIDLRKARGYYHGQRPLFNIDLESWARSSETSDYVADEHVFAGYGMGTFAFGRWTFLGGVRLEQTITQYSGKIITLNTVGDLRGVEDQVHNNSYLNVFPNAQLVYALGRFTNLRLAYSRSIGRPSYSRLAPNTTRDFQEEEYSQGNPDLNPMVSNNLDLLFEHYFMNVGQFTVGLYYKELSDFVYSFSDFLGPEGLEGDSLYAGWRFRTYKNGEEATVYGVEFTWQQNLTFLPGFLGSLGTYVSYSYSHSLSDVGRRDTSGDIIYARLQDQRPHVVNTGLDYSQGGFSAQISWHWGAPSISSYGTLRFVPGDPDVPINQRVYFDAYRDAARDLSLTLRYRLTDNFRIWADASNIMNHRSVSYHYHRDYYPSNSSLSGRRASLGLRYTF